MACALLCFAVVLNRSILLISYMEAILNDMDVDLTWGLCGAKEMKRPVNRAVTVHWKWKYYHKSFSAHWAVMMTFEYFLTHGIFFNWDVYIFFTVAQFGMHRKQY